MTKNNRGGFRPGSGRKPKPETEKYKKYMIVLRPDQIAWLNENILQSKAAFIRAAIDKAIAETKED